MSLEEAKQYLYNELNFNRSSQIKYYEREKMDVTSIWTVIENYFIIPQNSQEIELKLMEFLKENNLLKPLK